MVYDPPPMVCRPLPMLYRALYPWYIEPPTHGILIPYLWYIDPLPMVF